MNTPDPAPAWLRDWTAQTHHDHDTLSARHAGLMAATLGIAAPVAGAALPPLWHWLYFLEGLAPQHLGSDGHPRLGGFMPPVPLAQRMWAGGRVRFEAPLPLGATVEKRSRVARVEPKQGRSGPLVFVTVTHEVWHAGRCCVHEEQDIVYKAASASTAPPTARPPATAPTPLAPPTHRRHLTPDSTLLFRYSALTFNGHRIHYDADYCRAVEGYADLVVHGPLQATLLAGWACELSGGSLRHFDYRAEHPALRGMAIELQANRDGMGWSLQSVLPDGTVSMRATAR